MEAPLIPVEVEAPLGERAFEELARVLGELGYEPRRSGGASEGPDAAGEGGPRIALRVREPIAPDAANRLVERVSAWIRQRPAPKGRFRRRHPRPINLTVSGPGGETLSSAIVERA